MTTEKGNKVDAKKLHKMLHHCESRTVVHTGNKLGLDIQGTVDECESCGKGKDKQSKLLKISETKSKRRGERLFMDINTVKDKAMEVINIGC